MDIGCSLEDYRKRRMKETNGERELGKSVRASHHDNDDLESLQDEIAD